MSRATALSVVADAPPSLEALAKQCLERRAQLRRDLAAEEARLAWIRRELARERRVAFIRVEQLEREFLG